MFERSGPVRSDPAWFRRTMGQSEAASWLNISVRQIKPPDTRYRPTKVAKARVAGAGCSRHPTPIGFRRSEKA